MGNTLRKIGLGLLLILSTSSLMAGTWINITVEFDDTTLEDLASTYYGDVTESETIYQANKEVIGKNRKLRAGMVLEIPVTEKFRDQPEHLGWR
jgi:phage tail protein X